MDNQTTIDQISKLIETYEPSESTVKLVQDTPIVLLVGIAGAGKDTIKHSLLNLGGYHHIVSHTTRSPRTNNGVDEKDGVEYHFISLDESLRMLQDGAYVEAKFVHGTVYGTSVAEIQRAKKAENVAITDLDVQGVSEYKAISKNVIAIFVLPPNFDEWQRRLLTRYGGGGPDPIDLAKRMVTAINELEHALAQSYYHFVVNDNLGKAVIASDKIAHNRDTFNEVDESVRAQAEKLMKDIKDHLQ